jgi:2-polyprenyl-3-methyl-5-hydroxy-6-metoxy-1,4-benzoquinol methylase
MDREELIIQSWRANADNWIRLIGSNGIESRTLATNQAILEKVVAAQPQSVLDIGCGEGWLAQQLSNQGIAVSGVDVIPELIEKAREKAAGDFYTASYEDISLHKVEFPGLFDAIVINFALIGKESSEDLLASLPGYLSETGKLYIQTLHPYARKQLNDYVTGWKNGSWDGLGEEFTMPYEWYFRTVEDWVELFERSGFTRVHLSEAVHPHSGKLLSILVECAVK